MKTKIIITVDHGHEMLNDEIRDKALECAELCKAWIEGRGKKAENLWEEKITIRTESNF